MARIALCRACVGRPINEQACKGTGINFSGLQYVIQYPYAYGHLTLVVCCSYQALRMANFLTHPSLDAIQAFLIIGNVLSYNMNPGVAYILIGLTMRMAFSLGLQTDSHQFRDTDQYFRRRVWWALAWQDSHFSMSYDRPSSSALYGPEIPYRTPKPGFRSYAESMF